MRGMSDDEKRAESAKRLPPIEELAKTATEEEPLDDAELEAAPSPPPAEWYAEDWSR